jgi:hypothetical protein
MGGIKTISIIVAANIKGLEASLGKANKSITSFASNAARVGSALTFGITAPLAALGKSALDTFVAFEEGMTKVRAVTGATTREFKMLTDNARELGKSTRFTAQQFAELQLVLGRKGFDPKAIVDMTGAISKLSIATGEDLALAADVVASSINAFNLESTESERIANTLASAAANSSIQLNTFATAFGHAGASAHSVGVDIEELSAMMGVLMDNGIKASKAGTGLRKVFSKLNEEGIPFRETLNNLANGTMTLNDATKLVGETGATQLLILSSQMGKVNALTESYKTNTGELDRMTQMMQATSKEKIALMSSAINEMKLEMGALLAEALLPLIEKITELASEFSELDKGTKELIIQIGTFAALIGPLAMSVSLLSTALIPIKGIFGFLAKTVGPIVVPAVISFTTALIRLTKAGWVANGFIGAMTGAIRALTLAMIANPITAVVVGVLALGSAIYAFTRDTEDATVANDDFNESLRESVALTEDQAKALNNVQFPFLPGQEPSNIPKKRKKRKKEGKGFDIFGKEETPFLIPEDLINLDSALEDIDELNDKLEYDPGDEGLIARLTRIREQTSRIKAMSQEMAVAFADSVGSMMANGSNFADSLSESFKSLARSIVGLIVKALILAALISVIFPGRAAAGASFIGNFKNIASGGAAFGGSFANGGRPPLGKASLVGEQGPELFVPDQAGTVIPNHALGGGTVIPDVKITGDDLLIVFDRASRRKSRR